MMKNKILKSCFYILTVMLSIALCSCSKKPESGTTESAAQKTQIKIFAAASMTDIMKEAGALFDKNNNTEIVFNFAGSGTLGRQIESGAGADIFISANEKWMNYVGDKQLIVPESRCHIASNQLVVITPKNSTAKVEMNKAFSFKDSFKGYLAVGNFDSVPVGSYARESLKYMGWFDTLKGRFVFGSDTRHVLMYVARNEAEAGIVYSTDAISSSNVKIIATFPSESHKPITYSAAVIKDSGKTEAKQFMEFLAGPEMSVVFKKYGFLPKS